MQKQSTSLGIRFAIQELFGHRDVSTTIVTTHLLNRRGQEAYSLADLTVGGITMHSQTTNKMGIGQAKTRLTLQPGQRGASGSD